MICNSCKHMMKYTERTYKEMQNSDRVYFEESEVRVCLLQGRLVREEIIKCSGYGGRNA